ncbi:hypothetical protein J1N35_009006 [Gossypium stocksii]|uniref:Uncharacterized protein n=1 Tax=Gossypium stocksii TaxID=47602 RepID=A0A9D3WAD7_9ROSI|nr:hypothetical protein J1N35_009006 [Gossypium stocksii]
MIEDQVLMSSNRHQNLEENELGAFHAGWEPSMMDTKNGRLAKKKEAKELKSLAIDELIGSLQTSEINLEDVKRNKIKVGTAKVDDENLDGDRYGIR